MAFAAYADTVTGTAEIDLGSVVQVLFVGARVVTLGDDARLTEPLRTDHMLRAGWFSLGDHFDIGSDTDRNYWRAPIWLDFPTTLWTSNPTNVGTGLDPTTTLASRFRYSLSPGTEVQFLVLAL